MQPILILMHLGYFGWRKIVKTTGSHWLHLDRTPRGGMRLSLTPAHVCANKLPSAIYSRRSSNVQAASKVQMTADGWSVTDQYRLVLRYRPWSLPVPCCPTTPWHRLDLYLQDCPPDHADLRIRKYSKYKVNEHVKIIQFNKRKPLNWRERISK